MKINKNVVLFGLSVIAAGYFWGNPFSNQNQTVSMPTSPAVLKLPVIDSSTKLAILKRNAVPTAAIHKHSGPNYGFNRTVPEGTVLEVTKYGPDITYTKIVDDDQGIADNYQLGFPTQLLTPNTETVKNILPKKELEIKCADDDKRCLWQRTQDLAYHEKHDFLPKVNEGSRFAEVMNPIDTVPNIREPGRVAMDYTRTVTKGTIVAVIEYNRAFCIVKGKDMLYAWRIPTKELKHLDPPPGFEMKKAEPKARDESKGKKTVSWLSHTSAYMAG